MFLKHYAPKNLFCLRCFVQLDLSVQNKMQKWMKKKLILGNCYLNNRKCFRHIWHRWLWPSESRSRRYRVNDWKLFWHIWPQWPQFLCYTGWMCGPSLRKVGQGVLKLLIRNKKVTDGRTYRQTDSLKGGIKINNVKGRICSLPLSPLNHQCICRRRNKLINMYNVLNKSKKLSLIIKSGPGLDFIIKKLRSWFFPKILHAQLNKGKLKDVSIVNCESTWQSHV